MKRIRNIAGLVLTLALVAALAGHSSAGKGGGGKPGGDDGPTVTPIPYEITYLGTLPGYDAYSRANGMNNHGEVVGTSGSAAGPRRAFLYMYIDEIEGWQLVSLHEKFIDEGLIEFDDNTNSGTAIFDAIDINDHGEIVGYLANIEDGQATSTASFRYTPGFDDQIGWVPPQLAVLKSLDGGPAFGVSINNNGDIVGDDILWKSNDFDGNGNLNPTPLPGVSNISNGYVCGSSDGIAWRAPLVAGVVGPYQDLGTLFPKAKTTANGATSVNDNGDVVGYSQDRSKPFQLLQHGFRYDEETETLQDLGTLGGTISNANSINNYGDVVGIAQIASGDFHMYLYTDGYGMTDLEAAIVNLDAPLGPNGNTSSPVKINDHGEICGNTEGAGSRAYILRPIIPEL